MHLRCYRCKTWPCECRDGCTIIHGDAREVLPLLSNVTAIVTDPPYGLGFMGKSWDATIPAIWAPLLAACLPGSPLLAFGGTRTYHRLVCAIEDAGWEIRDCLAWVYGSGFPKSLDISKAIDKAAGVEREVVGRRSQPDIRGDSYQNRQRHGKGGNVEILDTSPTTEAAKLWNGWGTALKPAHEPIVLAMKPLDGTFAQNAERHGVAGLNVDGCRISLNGDYKCGANGRPSQTGLGDNYDPEKANQHSALGRWPANLIHDGSEEVLEVFPEQTGGGTPTKRFADKTRNAYGNFEGHECPPGIPGSSGCASRFFYCAKAGKAERGKSNNHSTVKPLDLMSYLCKLVSMPGYKGTLLDPFAGSGSTLLAGTRWFERVIGIERSEKYCKIAAERLRQEVLPFGDDEPTETETQLELV